MNLCTSHQRTATLLTVHSGCRMLFDIPVDVTAPFTHFMPCFPSTRCVCLSFSLSFTFFCNYFCSSLVSKPFRLENAARCVDEEALQTCGDADGVYVNALPEVCCFEGISLEESRVRNRLRMSTWLTLMSARLMRSLSRMQPHSLHCHCLLRTRDFERLYTRQSR